MDHINPKLVNFIDALSWGDVANIQDPKIHVERTRHEKGLKVELELSSSCIPSFLQHYDGLYSGFQHERARC